MVASTGIRDSGSGITVLSVSSPAMRMSQLRATTVYSLPSTGVRDSASYITTLANSTPVMRMSQAMMSVVVRGRVSNRKTRAWTLTLDGHDFYFLRLGDTSTLVYDVSTEQWSEWQSPDLTFWRPNTGWNWTDISVASFARGVNTDCILGDDAFGLLWTLDPDQGYDESPRTDIEDAGFYRKVVGGVPQRFRDTAKVGAVYLTCDLGSPSVAGAAFTLRTSDDYGKTWADQGTVTIIPDDYSQEIVWRSLGLIKAPGRIFEITDNGATVRIDGLDMR